MIDLPINLKNERDFEPLELEIWFDRDFSTQMKDIRPEVSKLRRYEGDALLTQWNTVIDLVSLILLDPHVGQEDKDELIAKVETVRDYYANQGISEEGAFDWCD